MKRIYAVVVAGELAFIAMLHAPDTADAARHEMAKFIARACGGPCAMDPVEIPELPLQMMAKWEMGWLTRYPAGDDSPNGMVAHALSTNRWPSRMRQGPDVTPRQRRALDRLDSLLDETAKRFGNLKGR